MFGGLQQLGVSMTRWSAAVSGSQWSTSACRGRDPLGSQRAGASYRLRAPAALRRRDEARSSVGHGAAAEGLVSRRLAGGGEGRRIRTAADSSVKHLLLNGG